MNPLLLQVVTSEIQGAVAIVAVSGGMGIALIAVVGSAIRKTKQARYREESRREIAAYVAEGSISPEDGAKLMDAGKRWSDNIGC